MTFPQSMLGESATMLAEVVPVYLTKYCIARPSAPFVADTRSASRFQPVAGPSSKPILLPVPPPGRTRF